MPAANCSPLSEIMLSGRPCSFQTLSLNNRANPSVLVLSVVGIKCPIFVSLSTTTKMALYPCTKGNFVMKSALICDQAFSGIKFGINFPVGGCIQFLFRWQASHPSTYRFTSLVTPGHQKFLITNSTCHKLHSAITPRILARFPRSRMRLKALMKTFQTMPKMCQSDQYSSRYQLISAGHWSANILRTAERGCLLLRAHGSSL